MTEGSLSYFVQDFSRGIGKQYKVVSDGKSTWIYHLDEKIYSVSNHQDFIDSNDDFLLGFINSLILDMKKDINFTSGINNFSELSESEKIQYIYDYLEKGTIDLNSINFKNDIIQGKYYEVIEFFIPKDNINFSVSIEPETLNIKGLHFSGQEDNMMFDFKEQVIRQTIPISSSSYTFRFIPPLGVKKVEEQISIDP